MLQQLKECKHCISWKCVGWRDLSLNGFLYHSFAILYPIPRLVYLKHKELKYIYICIHMYVYIYICNFTCRVWRNRWKLNLSNCYLSTFAAGVNLFFWKEVSVSHWILLPFLRVNQTMFFWEVHIVLHCDVVRLLHYGCFEILDGWQKPGVGKCPN